MSEVRKRKIDNLNISDRRRAQRIGPQQPAGDEPRAARNELLPAQFLIREDFYRRK